MASNSDVQLSRLDGPVVEVCVGTTSRKSFFIHEALLTSHSDFFQRALNGRWRESDDRVINLPDDEPEVFRRYTNLLYTELLPTKSSQQSRNASGYIDLCKLYVLAEKLQDWRSQDVVTRAMLKMAIDTLPGGGSVDHLSPAAIAIMYDGTLTGNYGRTVLMDIFAAYGNSNWISADQELLPKEFLLDLSVTLLSRDGPYQLLRNFQHLATPISRQVADRVAFRLSLDNGNSTI